MAPDHKYIYSGILAVNRTSNILFSLEYVAYMAGFMGYRWFVAQKWCSIPKKRTKTGTLDARRCSW